MQSPDLRIPVLAFVRVAGVVLVLLLRIFLAILWFLLVLLSSIVLRFGFGSFLFLRLFFSRSFFVLLLAVFIVTVAVSMIGLFRALLEEPSCSRDGDNERTDYPAFPSATATA